MEWIWVITFSVLGSTPEHGKFGAYSNRSECEQALINKKKEMLREGKEIAGTCYLTQRKSAK